MRLIRRALARIEGLFGRTTSADDLRAEMHAHLEMEIAENIRRGLPPGEARRRALVASGGMTQAAEQVREERSLPWLENFAADARYALRHFRKTPLATATMIVVLSVGIGTTVVLFTIMNSLATQPPPGIAHNEDLVRIRAILTRKDFGGADGRLMSWPEVREYAGRTELFSSVAAHADESAAIRIGDATTTTTASLIFTTPNYFSVLDVRPELGNVPASDPDVMQMTTSPSALISHAMWTQRFGSAPDIVGRMIRINDVPVQVAGVAPPRFLGTDGSNVMTVWVPLATYPMLQNRTAAVFASADSAFLSAIARRNAGVGLGAASLASANVASRVARTGPGDVASSDVVPLLVGNARVSERADLVVSGAVAGGFALLILLITCTNVSALLVGLAVARRREIGVRISLGAPRKRLVRQLLTESVLLSLVAAAIGLMVTAAGVRMLSAMLVDIELVVDWRVMLATSAVAIVTGLLFGLSPALHATRVSVGEVLKSSASSIAATRSRLQRGLVVAQIVLTQPLLVGLGVVITTMVSDMDSRASSQAPEQIAEIEVDAWNTRATMDERAGFITAAVDRIAAMPGVVAAMPMQLGTISASLTVHPADRVAGVTYEPLLKTRLSSAPKGYFRTFDIPVVRGRDFNSAELVPATNDGSKAPSYPSIIVGSDLARRLWGDADPLGRRLLMGQSASATVMVVVGVVDEVAAGPARESGITRIYVPYSAMNDGVIARTAGPALPLLNSMRAAVEAAAPGMPVLRAETVEQRDAQARRQIFQRGSAIAGGGLLALLLSAVGLYAVISFAVGARTREIGIRTALGARGGQVVRMFFMQGLWLSAIGLAVGLPLSILFTQVMSTTLNLPLASSPLLGAGIGAVVLVVASVAVWIPSRKASAVDPILALRSE